MESARAKSRFVPSLRVIDALVSERARFQRFLAARTGTAAEADDLLQQSLLKALQQGIPLHRGEKAVPWFYRMLRTAVADHYRQKSSEQRRADRLWTDMRAAGEDLTALPKAWHAAICVCFRGLLPGLKPRYAELIRRIDLNGEPKTAVSRDLKIKIGTLDVALHRARHALRRRMELLCGASSREKASAAAMVGKTLQPAKPLMVQV